MSNVLCGKYAFINEDFYFTFQLKITIFSLASSAVTVIENPKAIENGIIWSPCERYLVVAQRKNFVDYLGVYNCDTWEAIKVSYTSHEKTLNEIFLFLLQMVRKVLFFEQIFKIECFRHFEVS